MKKGENFKEDLKQKKMIEKRKRPIKVIDKSKSFMKKTLKSQNFSIYPYETQVPLK